eukprot:835429_1
MVREEWKSIELICLKKKYAKRSTSCYCINHRWFLRVVLWRFLEVSSRIGLLCVVWINLGGLSVFIIFGFEFLYLSIICYGLGTIPTHLNPHIGKTDFRVTR